MNQKKYVTMYDIVKEYLPLEASNNCLYDIDAAQKKQYLENFQKIFHALSVGQEIYSKLKDQKDKQYHFPNTTNTKEFVALLCINPSDYPDNLALDGFSRDETSKNISLIRKSDFENIPSDFLLKFEEKMINLGKELISDQNDMDMYTTTIQESLRSNVFARCDILRKKFQTMCTPSKLIAPHTKGFINDTDKIRFLDFWCDALDFLFEATGEIVEYMEEIRLDELESASTENPDKFDNYDFDYRQLFQTYSIRCNDETLQKYSKEKKDKVYEILRDLSYSYDDKARGKSEATRRNLFKRTKIELEKKLIALNLAENEVKEICENVTFKNTTSKPLKSGRILWEREDSITLLHKALIQYIQTNNNGDKFVDQKKKYLNDIFIEALIKEKIRGLYI